MNNLESIRLSIKVDLDEEEEYEVSFLDLIKDPTGNKIVESINCGETELKHFLKNHEKKFGPVALVKGKRIRLDDYNDQGIGYDVCDPFIDDSDMIENGLVAPDIMTEYGGFFINNDTLKIDDNKFIIDKIEGISDPKGLKKGFSKSISKMSKSQQLVSQARKRLNTSAKRAKKALSNNPSISSLNSDRTIVCEKPKEVTKPTQSVNIVSTLNDTKDILQSNTAPLVNKITTNTITNLTQETVQLQNGKKMELEDKNITNEITQTPQKSSNELPKDLPENIKINIESLKKMVEESKGNGNKLGDDFNSLLIENDAILCSKDCAKGLRPIVLRYLSNLLDIKYEAILRKINKLKGKNKKQKMEPLFAQLVDAIQEVMPSYVEKHETEMKVHREKVEQLKMNQSGSDTHNTSTETSVTSSTPQDTENKTQKSSTPKINAPKRYFRFNQNCKSIFNKILVNELESWKVMKNRVSMEDHLSRFFTTLLVPLWPPKWMTVSYLSKLSTSVVSEFKNCINSGKEFKLPTPTVKRKSETNRMKLAELSTSLSPNTPLSSCTSMISSPLPSPLPNQQEPIVKKSPAVTNNNTSKITIDLCNDSPKKENIISKKEVVKTQNNSNTPINNTKPVSQPIITSPSVTNRNFIKQEIKTASTSITPARSSIGNPNSIALPKLVMTQQQQRQIQNIRHHPEKRRASSSNIDSVSAQIPIKIANNGTSNHLFSPSSTYPQLSINNNNYISPTSSLTPSIITSSSTLYQHGHPTHQQHYQQQYTNANNNISNTNINNNTNISNSVPRLLSPTHQPNPQHHQQHQQQQRIQDISTIFSSPIHQGLASPVDHSNRMLSDNQRYMPMMNATTINQSCEYQQHHHHKPHLQPMHQQNIYQQHHHQQPQHIPHPSMSHHHSSPYIHQSPTNPLYININNKSIANTSQSASSTSPMLLPDLTLMQRRHYSN